MRRHAVLIGLRCSSARGDKKSEASQWQGGFGEDRFRGEQGTALEMQRAEHVSFATPLQEVDSYPFWPLTPTAEAQAPT